MKRSITVEVTDNDIAIGKPARCCACPIWHAAVRAIRPKTGEQVYVKLSCITHREATGQQRLIADYAVPPAARRFMDEFDRYETRSKVRPFTFTAQRI